MSPPRVVFVNNSRETFTPTISGAIATCLWEVARASEHGDIQPTVVTHDSTAARYPWAHTVVVPGVVERGGRRRDIARIRRRMTGWAHVHQEAYAHQALTVLRDLGPDVVVCNNDPEVASFLARRLPGVVVLHWFHNLEYAGDRFRRIYARSQRVRSVAVSRYLARAVEGAYRLTPGSVACVYPGVDASRFGATAVREGGPPVVGFVGRVCVEKGVDVLLRACVVLASARQDFAVQIVGDTNWGFSDPNPYRQLVDGLVDDLRARGVRVDRAGHVARRDIPAAIARTDLQVVPSRWDEPFGLVVLESMSSGVPVIVSATGGMPELTGAAGLLVAREDVSALADAIAALLDDEPRRAMMAANAREVAQEFTWGRTWAGLLDVAGVTSEAESTP